MKRIKKSVFWLAIVLTIIIFSAAESTCGELRIDDYVWDSKSQSFKMQMSTQAGKVSAVKTIPAECSMKSVNIME